MSAPVSRRRRITRIILWVCGGLAVLVLALAAAVVVPILTHQNAGSSGQTGVDEGSFPDEVSAVGADDRTRVLGVVGPTGEAVDLSQLSPGDELTVFGTGFNADNGIYLGFCKVPAAGEKPSPCLGGIPEGAESGELAEQENSGADGPALESQWITNNWAWRAFATGSYTDAENGAFTARLLVPELSMAGLDCRVEQCGIFTRNDHTASGDRVQDLYLRFDAAK